jgi:hypothetical protein
MIVKRGRVSDWTFLPIKSQITRSASIWRPRRCSHICVNSIPTMVGAGRASCPLQPGWPGESKSAHLRPGSMSGWRVSSVGCSSSTRHSLPGRSAIRKSGPSRDRSGLPATRPTANAGLRLRAGHDDLTRAAPARPRWSGGLLAGRYASPSPHRPHARLRLLARRRHHQRIRRDSRCRPSPTNHPLRDRPRTVGARRRVPCAGLRLQAPSPCPPHRGMGGRREDLAIESGAAVPQPPRTRARRPATRPRARGEARLQKCVWPHDTGRAAAYFRYRSDTVGSTTC